jgi:hypothetical protein
VPAAAAAASTAAAASDSAASSSDAAPRSTPVPASVSSDPLLSLLLTSPIVLLGRFEAVVSRRADGSFAFSLVTSDAAKAKAAQDAAAAAAARGPGAAASSSSSSSSSPAAAGSGGDVASVSKALADVGGAQSAWQQAQLLDLFAAVDGVDAGGAGGGVDGSSSVQVRAGDLMSRVEGQSVAGQRLPAVAACLASAPRNTKVTCVRSVSVPVLRVLLGMFEM